MSRTSFRKLHIHQGVRVRFLLTFSLDDLLIIGVIGSEEGYGLSGVEGLLQLVVYLPSVVALLNQDEGRRVGRGRVGLCAGRRRIE